MEPLDADVPVRPASPTRLALSAAAAALLVTTTGDALLACVLIGLAAGDAIVGGVAVAAILGTLARFGSTSLAGIAGAQAVLGPAVAVRPFVGAAGSALLALACVAVAPRREWWAGVPLGLLAGVVALGPSAVSWPDAVVRVAGAALGVGLVVFGLPRLPALPRWLAPALALVGLALAVAS